MNTRLEIASRILAAWFTEDSHEDYNEAAVCKSALCWADALISAERETRPRACGIDHSALRKGITNCPICGAEVPDAPR